MKIVYTLLNVSLYLFLYWLLVFKKEPDLRNVNQVHCHCPDEYIEPISSPGQRVCIKDIVYRFEIDKNPQKKRT